MAQTSLLNQTMPKISWWRIQYGNEDIAEVTRAIQEEHISLGPLTAQFEEQLARELHIPYIIATTSGSMAILMALLALGIGPGDEVIVPNRTWIAAAHAVALVGAKVILVDVQADVPILELQQIEKFITSRTKAIIPTALSGRAVGIQNIKTLAKKYGLFVIEDAAQAIFSKENGHYTGTQGDIGCFSLSVAKLIPTGQGGFLATHDEDLYRKLHSMRTHGVGDLLNCTYTHLGFNFRYTDLQAALGLAQLKTRSTKIAALNTIYMLYQKGLRDCKQVHLIPVDIEQGEVPLYIEVLCEQRAQLVRFLETKNIQVKIFYPNLNRAHYLKCNGQFPNADRFEEQGVTLPCGPDQSLENIAYTIQVLHEFDTQFSKIKNAPLHKVGNTS